MEGYMMLLELKTEIFRRRERIRVHLRNFHHGYKECQNKISHRRYVNDQTFLKLLWEVNSIEQIPPELIVDCKPAFQADLKKYFNYPSQSRRLLCEELKNQFHRENGLGVGNPEVKEALIRLQESGMEQISASRLLCSCPPQIAEISWQWTKEFLPLYSRHTATHPVEACSSLYSFFYSHRSESPEIINNWLSSYNLAPIDSAELDNFRKICVGVRQSLIGLKSQLSTAT